MCSVGVKGAEKPNEVELHERGQLEGVGGRKKKLPAREEKS